jgi:deazaflavin-dependent oxidoreductase (nitroreductase family)
MPTSDRELTWNAAMIAGFRANKGEILEGPLAGSRLLLLTTTGAKSGQPRTAPLGYTRDGDRYVVVGSNSGGPEQSTWYGNVKANPNVSVEVGTDRFQARARVTEGDERRRLLDAHIVAIPQFGIYEKMTERVLPVVVIERVDSE